MEIEIDGELIDAGPVTSALVCNGRFAGGGMHFSPQSRITDGWLEVVVIADAPTTTALRHLPKLYDGRIGDAPHIQTYRGREIALRSLGLPIAAEADGEVLGTTPVRATILPGAMHLMGVPDQLT